MYCLIFCCLLQERIPDRDAIHHSVRQQTLKDRNKRQRAPKGGFVWHVPRC